VTFRLVVAHGLPQLADVLVDELARPGADPFAPEVVAIPGDGVRAWLVRQLSQRLGASAPETPDGIVAGVRFVFPERLVRLALGEHDAEGAWSVGRLTWAVHDVLRTHGDGLGIPVDAVRARAIADLFDRYGLRRPGMVRRWEAGEDVDVAGARLAPHVRWQPQLWRAVRERIGGPSDAAALALAAAELRAGRREPLLPERVVLFGLASLPLAHLEVLASLARRRDVVVLAPTPSVPAWRRVRDLRVTLETHLTRAADPSASVTAHPLGATWGRAAREAHLLLHQVAAREGAEIRALDAPPPAPGSLLQRLQHDLRSDVPPHGPPTGGQLDLRDVLDPGDPSVRWHRCHGLARQVEVLRDVIVRLLEERDELGRPRFEPRDVTILCPDVHGIAPLVEAAFAGDPACGLPELPLRVADRSLREDDPLLDAVGALLDLLDGRFRASDVLAFAARPPVRRRFGLGPDDLGRLATWIDATNVRWGVDASSTAAFGRPPELVAHTWQAGLDQLLLGAAMADAGPRLGPADTVPYADVEGDAVELVGTLAELIHRLRRACDRLSTAQPVASWCQALADAASALFDVADAEAWQLRDLQHLLAELTAEAVVAGAPVERDVPPGELATLLAARLTGRPGRARYGTGAITVSSLAAQRGVPHRVVCLLGLDGDLGAGTGVAADDLTVAPPCVGDRDARSELRAQLLDAVLAAGERLVLCSTGRDIRTNANVPPAVPVAELLDVIDRSVRLPEGSPAAAPRALITVDHPRQAWSERNFVPGALGVEGPWSFDSGARAAAEQRRGQAERARFLLEPLAPCEVGPGDEVPLDQLCGVLRNPVQILLQRRLGITLEERRPPADDLVALDAGGLARWSVAERLLRARLAAGSSWSDEAAARWAAVQRAAGALPPLAFGDRALAGIGTDVAAIVELHDRALGGRAPLGEGVVQVSFGLGDGRVVRGAIRGVHEGCQIDVRAGRVRPVDTLHAWLRSALLTLTLGGTWRAVVVGRAASGTGTGCTAVTVRSEAEARRVVHVVTDLFDRARCSVVPAMPATTHALVHRTRTEADAAWRNHAGWGEGDDRWVRFVLGEVDLDDLLDEPPLADERASDADPAWGDGPSRIERWAGRLWGAVAATADVSDEAVPAQPAGPDAGASPAVRISVHVVGADAPAHEVLGVG